MMTPEIIILGPTATVAEALAEIRDPDWLVEHRRARCSSCQPPYKPPTGTYLGVVHFQRLLREPPSMELGRCLEQEPTITPDIAERDGRRAARQLQHARASASSDEAGHLLGAITVDDVLDRTLPAGWRQRRRGGATPAPAGGVAAEDGPDDSAASDLTDAAPAAAARRALRPRGVRPFSEAIARYLGTARFLVCQTRHHRRLDRAQHRAVRVCQFDPWDRGLVLLTLVLSLQAPTPRR